MIGMGFFGLSDSNTSTQADIESLIDEAVARKLQEKMRAMGLL